MNERTHLFIKIYLSHLILERVDVGCAWEVSWRRGQTATYWPKIILTIAALLSHLGWVAQSWVTEGPKLSVCHWFSIRHLVPNWLQLQLELTQAICGTWFYNCLHPPASAVPWLIYTGVSLDWRPGRASICNNKIILLSCMRRDFWLTIFYLTEEKIKEIWWAFIYSGTSNIRGNITDIVEKRPIANIPKNGIISYRISS